MDRCRGDDCKEDGKSRLAAHFPFYLSPADFDSATSCMLLQKGGHPSRESDSKSASEAQPHISKLSWSAPHAPTGLFLQASTLALARKPSQPPVEITRSPQRKDDSSNNR